MRADRIWGKITSGAHFEALVTTLVWFEDPKAVLFGRRGKDGGQDARSGDGLRVFQAKYHQDNSSAKAIADAKKEAEKVSKYRTPGNERYEQWKDIKHWCLVTNSAFNPTDVQTWNEEVVPLFTAQGLTADFLGRAYLDGLLDKHPEVDRAFFQNEIRTFLSLPEVLERLPREEPFLLRPALGAFFGRKSEMMAIREFMVSDELFLVVHGAGGTGKTRLLVECGEEIASEGEWQVLWANVASMASSATWFEAIVPERPTLLLVDEPDDEQVLRLLSEQLGGGVGRAAKWKVAVSVRSPKDPVLRFLFGQRLKSRVRELSIGVLSQSEAEDVCTDLLGTGPLSSQPEKLRKEAAAELVRRFYRHPIWLTLAVHVLETRGDLSSVPKTADALADLYLDEIINQQRLVSPEKALNLLRWVALIGTANRDDDSSIMVLADGSGLESASSVKGALASLVERRALVQRGARDRLVELKPDVLRDHLLLKWLAVRVGYGDASFQPSAEAKQLVQGILDTVLKGAAGALARAVLISVARTEMIFRFSEQSVALLDSFFAGIQERLGQTTAGQRMIIAEVLTDIAGFRPADMVAVSRAFRTSPAATETISGAFRSREVTQDDIILELAWPLFHAAMGAQSHSECRQVLEELSAVVDVESQIPQRRPRGLPNDGKRAADLLVRTLYGGPQFCFDFNDVAVDLAMQLLSEAETEVPGPGRISVLKCLLGPLVSVERRQMWSEGFKFHFQTNIIYPSHAGWETRNVVLSKIKEFLASETTPLVTRILLWNLFADAHRSVAQYREPPNDKLRKLICESLRSDLDWAHSILNNRMTELNELKAARDLWDWHFHFEKNQELKSAAERLEAIYLKNNLAGEFNYLLSRDDFEERGTRATKKADELAAQTAVDIDAFLERAITFLGNERELYQIFSVAWRLGTHAPEKQCVRDFISGGLSAANVSPRTEFATCAAEAWVTVLRGGDNPTACYELVVDLTKKCGSDAQRISFLQRLYGLPRPKESLPRNPDEYNFVRSCRDVFLKNNCGLAFIACTGWAIHHAWPSLKTLLEETLSDIPGDQVHSAASALIDAIYWAIRGEMEIPPPPDLGVWLLDQINHVPDIDSIGGTADWNLQEILKRVGHAPLSWLPPALQQRAQMEVDGKYEKVRAVGYHLRVSRFVNPISEDQAESAEVVTAIKGLLGFVSAGGTIGYYFNQIIRDIDPKGLVVPNEITKRLIGTKDQKELWRLSRVGGAYAVGSPPWRIIAKPVIVHAAKLTSEKERYSLFSALTDQGIRSYSGTPGEVPQVFVMEVRSARESLEAETDRDFIPFWEWRLKVAEAELKEQEEEAKEVRGE